MSKISKDNISLKNVHGENANNSNETAEFYLFLASRNKLRKIPEPELIAYIYETIEKLNDLKIDFAKTNRNFFVATNKLAQNLTENNEKDNKNKGKTEAQEVKILRRLRSSKYSNF